MLDSLLCWLVKSLGAVLCRLPPGVCIALGAAGGRLACFLQPRRAQVGRINLKAAFGDRLKPGEADRIVRSVFAQLGAGIFEMLRLPVIDAAYIDRYVTIEGAERFEQAVHSPRHVIVLTGHMGSWELTSIVAGLKGYPLVALARAQNELPKLYALLLSYRESKGCRIVHKGGAMRQLIQALRQREIVGIVGDQASRQGIPVDFLGRRALFATGPFALAHSSDALVFPSFIHRTRGAHHRMVIEPPIDVRALPGDNDAQIRGGVERFADSLARQIEQHPGQWLWVHKRWKHTPDRRIVVLSDGKLGHVKQSMTVVQALKAHQPQAAAQALRDRLIEVRYRHRLGRLLVLLASWLQLPRGISWAIARLSLQPETYRHVATAHADVVISCGSSTAPVNLLLSRESRAKSIVLMNPAPLPLKRFSLAIVPAHDAVRKGHNVVQIQGALTSVREQPRELAREHLENHPRFRPVSALRTARRDAAGPVIAVFLGGDTDEYQLTTAFADTLMQQVLGICDEFEGTCLVTTSRRTHAAVERHLEERLGRHPRCPLLLLAGRDQLNGTVDGMLGWADIVVVTAESVSMVSEACSSGRYVIVVEPPRRDGSGSRMTKAQRYIRGLAEQGYARIHPLPELGHAIRRCLTDRPPVRRLETYATVVEAVKRLL